jgi:organic radical activating enzyme
MIVKEIRDEDFTNYKKPSMFIGFSKCTWKCEKECGMRVCQNSALAEAKGVEIEIDKLVDRYINNQITKAVVCGGLEPIDTWKDLKELVTKLRLKTNDDIIIYTGYKEEEIVNPVKWLSQFPNIIIKFGRFVPNQQKHYDDVLGVSLASNNQHARRIS